MEEEKERDREKEEEREKVRKGKRRKRKGMSSNYLFVSFPATLTKSNFFLHGIGLTEAQDPSSR